MTFLFTYTGRVNPIYYLLLYYTWKGGSRFNALLMCIYLLILFTLLMKLITNRRQARRTLERLKTLRKYFSLKFRSSLTSIFSSNIQVCITCQSHSFVVELVQNQEEATDLMLRKALQSMSLPLTSVGLMVNHLGEVESSCLGWNSCSAT